MPDDWDAKLKYYTTEQGRVRSRAELRSEIDKLTEYVKRQSKLLAQQAQEGAISAKEFELSMRELLKSGHIIASSVGRGGRARMTSTDWARVGRKIEWQNGYLKKFSRLIARDLLSGPASSNRVQMYASALHVSYYQSAYVEHSDIRDVPRDKEGKEKMARLVTNSEEGCQDCANDEAEGWVPIDTFGELGTRSCGDFCKCDIEFSWDDDE
jgi:hypothetical protein